MIATEHWGGGLPPFGIRQLHIPDRETCFGTVVWDAFDFILSWLWTASREVAEVIYRHRDPVHPVRVLNTLILAVNALAVNVLAVNRPLPPYMVSKRVICPLNSAKKRVTHPI